MHKIVQNLCANYETVNKFRFACIHAYIDLHILNMGCGLEVNVNA